MCGCLSLPPAMVHHAPEPLNCDVMSRGGYVKVVKKWSSLEKNWLRKLKDKLGRGFLVSPENPDPAFPRSPGHRPLLTVPQHRDTLPGPVFAREAMTQPHTQPFLALPGQVQLSRGLFQPRACAGRTLPLELEGSDVDDEGLKEMRVAPMDRARAGAMTWYAKQIVRRSEYVDAVAS